MRIGVYGKDKKIIRGMESFQSLELSYHHLQDRSIISPRNKQGNNWTNRNRKRTNHLVDKLHEPTNSSKDPSKIKWKDISTIRPRKDKDFQEIEIVFTAENKVDIWRKLKEKVIQRKFLCWSQENKSKRNN